LEHHTQGKNLYRSSAWLHNSYKILEPLLTLYHNFYKTLSTSLKGFLSNHYAANNLQNLGLHLNSPFPMMTNMIAGIPKNQTQKIEQIDPANARPQCLLISA
jgi:hypothetical protein